LTIINQIDKEWNSILIKSEPPSKIQKRKEKKGKREMINSHEIEE